MTVFMRILLAPLLAAALLLSACDDPGSEPGPGSGADVVPVPETAEVKVHFRDSSVPPEYHRSWDLTLDSSSIELVVDSYGDLLAEESARMPAAEWEEFVGGLADELDDLGEPAEPEAGCAGGTGMMLEVSEAGEADTLLKIDNCNTDDNAAMMGRVEELVRPFTRRVHLDQHTRS